jgi:hypothetical protein
MVDGLQYGAMGTPRGLWRVKEAQQRSAQKKAALLGYLVLDAPYLLHPHVVAEGSEGAHQPHQKLRVLEHAWHILELKNDRARSRHSSDEGRGPITHVSAAKPMT